MQKNTNPTRNSYLDTVKGVLIICVVVAHCVQHGSGIAFYRSNLFFENWLFKSIYSFHMPLFMLLCGYFFAHTIARKSWQETLITKAKSLLLPILVWSVVPIGVFVSKLLKGLAAELTTGEIIENIIHTITNNLWFLWAILYNIVIVLLVNRLFKDNLWVYGAIFILQFFLPDALHLYCFMYPYFVLGYLYNKQFKNSTTTAKALHIKNRRYLHIATGVVFIAMLCMFSQENYIYTSKYNILNGNPLRQLYIDIFRFAIGLVGSLFMLLTIKYLFERIGERRGVLVYLGKATMGIYIISSYLNPLLLDICRKLGGCNYLYIAIESAVIIALSLSFMLLIKRSRVASRILLGS